MMDEGSLTQQQTGGSMQTSNPQSVPSSNLQPQQPGLQGVGSQVLGTSTFLEQSSTAAISVSAQGVDQEISELKTSQEVSNDSLGSIFAGREVFVIGAIGIIVAVLAYALVRQIMHEER